MQDEVVTIEHGAMSVDGVPLEVALDGEAHGAEAAQKGLLAGVGAHVSREVPGGGVGAGTHGARELPSAVSGVPWRLSGVL